jgi:hypothetical protein
LSLGGVDPRSWTNRQIKKPTAKNCTYYTYYTYYRDITNNTYKRHTAHTMPSQEKTPTRTKRSTWIDQALEETMEVVEARTHSQQKPSKS